MKPVRLPACEAQGVDFGDMEHVILEYMPTIKHIAKRVARRLSSYIGLDDLVSTGVIGLLDAKEKYDANHDNPFKAYAVFRIRGAMIDELRNLDWAPRSVRHKETKLYHAHQALERTLARQVRHAEIAEFLGIPLEQFHAWRHQAWMACVLGFDDILIRAVDGKMLNLLEIIAQDDAQGPVQRMQAKYAEALLSSAIADLPPQEKSVIALYYDQGLTMKEIGNMLHVVESRVSQIRAKAIASLRAQCAG